VIQNERLGADPVDVQGLDYGELKRAILGPKKLSHLKLLREYVYKAKLFHSGVSEDIRHTVIDLTKRFQTFAWDELRPMLEDFKTGTRDNVLQLLRDFLPPREGPPSQPSRIGEVHSTLSEKHICDIVTSLCLRNLTIKLEEIKAKGLVWLKKNFHFAAQVESVKGDGSRKEYLEGMDM
jgi:hypothetical protein